MGVLLSVSAGYFSVMTLVCMVSPCLTYLRVCWFVLVCLGVIKFPSEGVCSLYETIPNDITWCLITARISLKYVLSIQLDFLRLPKCTC